jgi:hypothetical protein
VRLLTKRDTFWWRDLECLGVQVCDQWGRSGICLSCGQPVVGGSLCWAMREEEWCRGATAVMKKPAEGLAGRHGGGASCS